MEKADKNRQYFLLEKAQEEAIRVIKKAGYDPDRIWALKLYCTLDASIDAERLFNALRDTVNAHEVYSAMVEQHDGREMLKRTYATYPFNCDIKEIADEEYEEKAKEYLTSPREKDEPLYRFRILVTPTRKYLLMLISHVICDGLGVGAIVKEVIARYDGRNVDAEGLNFFDWCAYRDDFQQSEEGKKMVNEFRSLLKDYPVVTYDYVLRKPIRHSEVLIDKNELKALRPLLKQKKLTVSDYLFAAFSLALMRLFGKDRVVYGMDAHGRLANFTWTPGDFALHMPVLAKIPASGRVDDFLEEFASQLKVVTTDYIVVGRSIMEECASYIDDSITLNIQLRNAPFRIGGTSLSIDVLPFPIYPAQLLTKIIIGADNYIIAFDSNRFDESQLKEIVDDIRNVMNGILHKEMINEL